jgi:hypothetical protein
MSLAESTGEPRSRTEALMLTVEADPARVEMRLVNGEIGCPECEAGLHPWGWASWLEYDSGYRLMCDPVLTQAEGRRLPCVGCRRPCWRVLRLRQYAEFTLSIEPYLWAA